MSLPLVTSDVRANLIALDDELTIDIDPAVNADPADRFAYLLAWAELVKLIALDVELLAKQLEARKIDMIREAPGEAIEYDGLRYTAGPAGRWVVDHDRLAAKVAGRSAVPADGTPATAEADAAAIAAARLMQDLYVYDSAVPNATPVVAKLRCKMDDVAEWKLNRPKIKITPAESRRGK